MLRNKNVNSGMINRSKIKVLQLTTHRYRNLLQRNQYSSSAQNSDISEHIQVLLSLPEGYSWIYLQWRLCV